MKLRLATGAIALTIALFGGAKGQQVPSCDFWICLPTCPPDVVAYCTNKCEGTTSVHDCDPEHHDCEDEKGSPSGVFCKRD